MAFISASPNARADFRKLALPVSPAQAGSYVLNQVQAGTDVALAVDDGAGAAMLDEAAGRLAGTRTRVLRAAPAGGRGLTLSSLVAQVARQSAAADLGDVQTKGYRALTRLDHTCDRIALLVSDAQTLDRNALDYLKLVRREDAPLSIVLAGSPVLFDILDQQKLDTARARVKTSMAADPPPAPAAFDPLPVVPPLPAPAAPDVVAVNPVRPLHAASAAETPATPGHWRQWLVVAGAFAAGVVVAISSDVWLSRNLASPSPAQKAAVAARPDAIPNAGNATSQDRRPNQPSAATEPAPTAPGPKAVPPLASNAVAPTMPPPPPAVTAPTPPPSPTVQAGAVDAQSTTPVAAANPADAEEVGGIPIPPIPPPPMGQPDLSTAASDRPEQAGRQRAPRQARATASPRHQPSESTAQVWDNPYPTDPPAVIYQPVPQDAEARPPPQAPSYIGTFTTDAAGNRVFRLNR